MELVFEVFVPGKPVPKDRPRAKIVHLRDGTRRIQMYTTEATVNWESLIEQHARTKWRNRRPIAGRLAAYAEFWLPKPKSVKNDYPITDRADTDNLLKAVLDAVERAGVLTNDRIITDVTAVKRYADPNHPTGALLKLWVP